jgi:hypothetical protein
MSIVRRSSIRPWWVDRQARRNEWDSAQDFAFDNAPTAEMALSAGPGLRWMLRGRVRRTKRDMLRRGFVLVSEVSGKNRDLVESGTRHARELGQPLDPRAKTVFLAFEGPASSTGPATPSG